MSLNILRLNDDCLACVLNYLPIDNHINFSQVCNRFRDVWLCSIKTRYTRLEIGDTDKSENVRNEILLLRQVGGYVKHIIVNVNRHFNWNETFLKEICRIVQTMTHLEHAILCLKDIQCSGNVDLMLRSFKDLPNIKGIAAYKESYIVESLVQYNDFRHFNYNLKMSKRNEISLLNLRDDSIYAILSDLVRHSTGIDRFIVEIVQDVADYTPLAALPNLSDLVIQGNYYTKNGNLTPLLAALFLKQTPLHRLAIYPFPLGYAETAEIARLISLTQLSCKFQESQYMELLTSLLKLEYLTIFLPPSTFKIDSFVLKLLENCKNLKNLEIYMPSFSTNFITQAYEVLKKVRDPVKQVPLTLQFGGSYPQSLDGDMSLYLKVFGQINVD